MARNIPSHRLLLRKVPSVLHLFDHGPLWPLLTGRTQRWNTNTNLSAPAPLSPTLRSVTRAPCTITTPTFITFAVLRNVCVMFTRILGKEWHRNRSKTQCDVPAL
ncbi:hypothetical protein BD310DRAFT_684390 [Dichomitus squalens]|uniref:Uncharacterized protein n=1 Tax=Dichomitus squalens TaxID=114155 RepID=A0A4Q9PMH7_9APHY|nr:hypothetical protein BD310DRAFT_684390 [Dichomitus squalens]